MIQKKPAIKDEKMTEPIGRPKYYYPSINIFKCFNRNFVNHVTLKLCYCKNMNSTLEIVLYILLYII